MPRSAHRRCKVQGPTCNGIAHPGHDQCARCLHDVVRPRMREEKEAVRARRAKRHQLSRANRSLISEVDLKEPQMRAPEETPLRLPPVEPIKPISLKHAIGEVELDKKLEGIPEDDRWKAVGDMLFQKLLQDPPSPLPVFIPAPPKPPEEEPVPPETVPAAPPVPFRRRRGEPEPRAAEIAEMYRVGMPILEIKTAYGISSKSLYAIIDKAGVPPRGRGTYLEPVKEALVPQPVTSSPPVSTPDLVVPTPNGVVSGLTEWVVTYEVVKTETVVVAAKSFNDAAAAVDARGITVTSVARKRE